MSERFLHKFLEASLAEAVAGGLSRYDDLADEIYDLEERLRPHQSLGEFIGRCRSLGLPLAALEDKLAARASAYAEAEGQAGLLQAEPFGPSWPLGRGQAPAGARGW